MNDVNEFMMNGVICVFDEEVTAQEFLSDDGEGGFAVALRRMIREIERLREIEKAALGGALVQPMTDIGDTDDKLTDIECAEILCAILQENGLPKDGMVTVFEIKELCRKGNLLGDFKVTVQRN